MKVRLILVPYDSGKYEMGMGKGPGRIWADGFEEKLIQSGHMVTTHRIVTDCNKSLTDIQSAFQINTILSKAVADTRREGMLPIVLAGNCITAVGTLSGIHEKQISILWLDAHGDFNTPETTTSGYLDGMALSIACGKCWKSLSFKDPLFQSISEDKVILLGARDIDPEEAQNLEASKIKIVSIDTVRRNGYTIPEMKKNIENTLYIHFDADVIDAGIGKANQFAAPNGILPNEIKNILRWSASNFRIQALAVTAYNPEHDCNGKICEVIREVIAATVESISSRQLAT